MVSALPPRSLSRSILALDMLPLCWTLPCSSPVLRAHSRWCSGEGRTQALVRARHLFCGSVGIGRRLLQLSRQRLPCHMAKTLPAPHKLASARYQMLSTRDTSLETRYPQFRSMRQDRAFSALAFF